MTEAEPRDLGYDPSMGEVPDELEILAEQLPKPNDLIEPTKQLLKDHPAMGVGLTTMVGGALLLYELHEHHKRKPKK